MADWNISRRGFMVGTGTALLAATRRQAFARHVLQDGRARRADDRQQQRNADDRDGGRQADRLGRRDHRDDRRRRWASASSPRRWSGPPPCSRSRAGAPTSWSATWDGRRRAPQALLITDAIYYAGAFVCMKQDQPFTSSISVERRQGPLDRHRQRLHHRAGDEEAAGRRRGEALRQQRRLRARRGGRTARFRRAGRAAGRLHDPEEPELEPQAGGARARSGVPAADQQAAHRDGHEPGELRPVRRGERRREMDVEDQAERRADAANTASAIRTTWSRRRRTRASASTATPPAT